MSLISRFISQQAKILSRRANRLTLKQQRLILIPTEQNKGQGSNQFHSNCTDLTIQLNFFQYIKKISIQYNCYVYFPRLRCYHGLYATDRII